MIHNLKIFIRYIKESQSSLKEARRADQLAAHATENIRILA